MFLVSIDTFFIDVSFVFRRTESIIILLFPNFFNNYVNESWLLCFKLVNNTKMCILPFEVNFGFDWMAIPVFSFSICRLCRVLLWGPTYRLVWAMFWRHDPQYPAKCTWINIFSVQLSCYEFKEAVIYLPVSCAVVVWHITYLGEDYKENKKLIFKRMKMKWIYNYPIVECTSIRREIVHHLQLINLDALDEGPCVKLWKKY